jgi:hypothetical protein
MMMCNIFYHISGRNVAVIGAVLNDQYNLYRRTVVVLCGLYWVAEHAPGRPTHAHKGIPIKLALSARW